MSVRKFLVPVSGSESAAGALRAGLLLARMWNAHLEVLHVSPGPQGITPYLGEGVSSVMIGDMMTAAEREDNARIGGLLELFARATEETGIPVGPPLRGANEPSASFLIMTGAEERLVAHRARLADLTVVPHPLAGEDVAAAEALHAVLFDSGRPVLLAPVLPPPSIGSRVAVGWNGTAHAAAALASAMPFIRQARAVRILVSDEYSRPGPGAEDVRDYILHHGVEAEIAAFMPRDRDTGAGLLAAAEEFGADLLAMGAYSTASRLRQLILGGITRHVLEHARIPVLMHR
ncbi:universal stress protein [Acidocella sp.]|uniref:universal stress protein n=1 Tax=Acidocella sp. TaxID=50710 RepID=UPI00262347F7|nr:universal stress protein [Acidocella sp.]